MKDTELRNACPSSDSKHLLQVNQEVAILFGKAGTAELVVDEGGSATP